MEKMQFFNPLFLDGYTNIKAPSLTSKAALLIYKLASAITQNKVLSKHPFVGARISVFVTITLGSRTQANYGVLHYSRKKTCE